MYPLKYANARKREKEKNRAESRKLKKKSLHNFLHDKSLISTRKKTKDSTQEVRALRVSPYLILYHYTYYFCCCCVAPEALRALSLARSSLQPCGTSEPRAQSAALFSTAGEQILILLTHAPFLSPGDTYVYVPIYTCACAR